MRTLSCVLLLILSSATSAQFFDGNDLHEGCRAESETFGAGLCLGFIVGVIDASGVCVPDYADLGQVRRVVRLYLKVHPDQREYSAESLVRQAIETSLACPKEEE